MKTENTLALVKRAQEGDQEAYDQLFSQAAERVLLFIRARLGRRLRDQLESMDVLQETYLEAHRAFDRFELKGEHGFARWLCRIAENRIRGLAGHYGAKKRAPAKKDHRQISQVLEELKLSGTGPVTAAARLESRRTLENALSELEDDAREVLLYRFFQNRNIDDIASLMGRSPSAVRRLLGRSMKQLGRVVGGKND